MFWILVVPAILLAFLSLRGDGKRAAYAAQRLSEPSAHLPPASVIVPVKGPDEGLRENLAALAALDYPDYELIVVAHRAEDIPPGVLPEHVRVVLAGNRDEITGDKVLNLIAAVRATRRRSEIFAFADSDGRVPAGWLRALAEPLAEARVGAVTGFRWHAPDPAGFWSMCRSLWNAVAFGTFGAGDCRFAWGGAMAMRKETFFDVRMLEVWKGAVSDDYALAAAVHHAGLQIAWAPGATVPAFDHAGALELFGWIRRQMLVTRVHAPAIWWPALVAHVIYAIGMLACLAAGLRGYVWAWPALAAQLAPGMIKGRRRARVAQACLPELNDWFQRHAWVFTWGTPLGTWLWMAALLLSAGGHTVRWRGRKYKLRRPEWPET